MWRGRHRLFGFQNFLYFRLWGVCVLLSVGKLCYFVILFVKFEPQYSRKPLQRSSHESSYSYTICQRAGKEAKLRAHRLTVVHHLLKPDRQKQVCYCHCFQQFLHSWRGKLDITWFTDEAWFQLSGYMKAQNPMVWDVENPYVIHEEPLHL